MVEKGLEGQGRGRMVETPPHPPATPLPAPVVAQPTATSCGDGEEKHESLGPSGVSGTLSPMSFCPSVGKGPRAPGWGGEGGCVCVTGVFSGVTGGPRAAGGGGPCPCDITHYQVEVGGGTVRHPHI